METQDKYMWGGLVLLVVLVLYDVAHFLLFHFDWASLSLLWA